MPPFYHELGDTRGKLGEGAGLVDAAEAQRRASSRPEVEPAALVPHRLDLVECDPTARRAVELERRRTKRKATGGTPTVRVAPVNGVRLHARSLAP
jgi:hypothetical protein